MKSVKHRKHRNLKKSRKYKCGGSPTRRKRTTSRGRHNPYQLSRKLHYNTIIKPRRRLLKQFRSSKKHKESEDLKHDNDMQRLLDDMGYHNPMEL